ncbi:hypothetical protein AK830_g498 [Neonectria ditissima]|uniref:UBZ4-type domain-containing protein n=1 Tax=Neonectria ditissima TaxID=78410 RepID=A0A0P7BW54_9HYPO|nr:hypothetical protein AK830_g498 [Neonectria ditissima]
MNRPRNRQPRPPGQNQPRGPTATPQQVAGTVPTIRQVVRGASVFIVLKDDQPTGEETKGVVQAVLTRGNHPRGIKVRLSDGQVGRVQRLAPTETPTTSTATTTTAPAVSGNRIAPAASASRFSNRYTDVRYDDEFPEGPPPRSLVDFMPELDSPPKPAGDAAVKCPLCEEFEGDEAAVTHHIDQKHL